MDRRKFLTVPLAAMAAPGALLAANAAPGQAATRALKGIGHGGKDALALKQIKSLKVDWYYTWGSKYTVTTNPAFVPMVKDRKRLLEQDAIGYVTKQLPVTKTKHLLGFNEPDHRAQANMSVDEAIRLWPRLQRTGLRLGSPATVNPTSRWLSEFMSKARKAGLRVDFMTMHCYAWPNAESFLGKVKALHEKYGKPIWVTEYAVADWSATKSKPSRYSRAETEDFMRATVAGMRAMPYVERFAWKTRSAFDPIMGSSALYHTNGSLTSTGRLYASL
ncbi:MAG: glycosyl hydrolase [Actinomycetota bacterium]